MTAAARGRLLLGVGAGVGILLAALGVLAPVGGDPGSDGIARVNDSVIRRETFEDAVARLAADKRNPLTDRDRAHVLQRLIEEELLLQRGVEIGLVEAEPSVRKALVAALIESIVVEAESSEPDEGDLRAFYAANGSYFARPERARVQQIFFRSGGDRETAYRRARGAAEALRTGASFADTAQGLGDPALPPLPDASLPPGKLREYLGPTLAEAVLALEPGAVTPPLESPAGWHLLRLVETESGAAPRYEEVRAQVRAEYRRREGDRALRAYLDGLRDEARIALAADAPR